ncbi:ethylene-responsive transcription factor ERF014-like [Hibiscus syriacus]|uniref:ethylene-responsive transcription factor ERF014-like n=1 Tax=Hibiscus syriacus TaxID=106335 RepID=UPI001921FBDB|nr:ethylene-responsive transcription factor ERF014-like [Hibiscus syriacus]
MVKADMKKIQPEASKQMSSPPSSSCKKKYKGVRMRSWGSWVSEIRAPNQKTRIWLGSYSTPEAAARAYDAALLCLKGSSANLNFAITSSHYIPDGVLSPKSIQRVAAAAANGFVNSAAAAAATISPPPSSESSSSSTSSPSMSSSPSDQVVDYDDDYMSLIQSLVAEDEPISLMEPWYSSFNQMLNVSSLVPPSTINEFYDEGDDIRLWSFC